MHVMIDYPSAEDEVGVVNLVRGEEIEATTVREPKAPKPEPPPRIPQDAVFAAREEIGRIHVSDAIARYIVDLVYSTRTPENYSEDLRRWIDVGSSPRASLSLDKCGRTHAWLRGRDYVDPEDVRAIAHDVLRHRLLLSYEAQGEGVGPDAVIDEIVNLVALP
jgi:MoxR-like ATPase